MAMKILKVLLAIVLGFMLSGVVLLTSPGWLYWKLAWSQGFWETVFPSAPQTSAPSEGCLLGMIASNAVVPSLLLYLVLSIKWKRNKNST
jgi:hypothetical protein